MPMTTMSSHPNPIPESPSASPSGGDSVAPGSGTPVPIPTKISASFNEIHELAAEKVALAEKLIELITRTRAKLDVDISKVKLLQGEPPALVAAQASASLNMKPAGLMALTGATAASVNTSSSSSANVDNFGAPGRNPALVISESLRNAMATQPQTEGRNGVSSGSSHSASGHANKSM
jgi:chromatin modification-related protein YNG2